MTGKSMSQTDPLAITGAEQQAIIDDIRRSNQLRRDAQLPLIDEDQRLADELGKLIEAKYRALLQPYLAQAFTEVKEQYGFAGRLSQTMQVWQLAQEALKAETGVINPRQKSPNIMKALLRYANGTLASAGVS